MELLRETRWSRTFRVDSRTLRQESRFLTEDLHIDPDEIEKAWKSWSAAERLDFAAAFAAKPQLTPDDHRMLLFLLDEGSSAEWNAIATRLPEHPSRERILTFLLEHLRDSPPVANFIQALQLMGDSRAVKPLEQIYRRYEGIELAHAELVDYISCLAALWRITGRTSYLEKLTSLAHNSASPASDFACAVLKQSSS